MPIEKQQYQKMYGHIRPSSKHKEAIASQLRNNITSRSDKVDLYRAVYDLDADGDLKTWAQIELETMGFTADSTPDMFFLSNQAQDVPENIGNDGEVYAHEAIRDMNLLLFDPKSKAF
jgi:hypothetical protein